MADISHIPYGDWKVPAIPLNDDGFLPLGNVLGGTRGIVSGLFPFVEGGGRAGSTWGPSARRGRHCVMNFDVDDGAGTAANGVWLELYTLGDSDLTAGDFDASGQRLQEQTGFGAEIAVSDAGPPEAVSAQGYVLHADGKANMPGPGVVYPDGVVVFDGVSTYTDVTAVLTDGDFNTFADFTDLAAGGDYLYVGSDTAGATFGAVMLRITGNIGSVPTPVPKYWNGSSWATLTTSYVWKYKAVFDGPQHIAVRWTVPSDWANTDESGNLPFNRLWVRIEGATVAGGWKVLPTHCWIQHGTNTTSPTFAHHVNPAAYHVSDDPGNQAPVVIPWGLSNWWGGPAQNVLSNQTGSAVWVDPYDLGVNSSTFDQFVAVYYDEARDIQSQPTYGLLPATGGAGTAVWQFNTVPTAENASAHVRLWLRNGSTKQWHEAILGTDDSDSDSSRAISLPITGNDTIYIYGVTATTILPAADLGGPPNHMRDGDYTNAGGPVSVAYLRRRAYALGGRAASSDDAASFANTIRASAINRVHEFPDTYTYLVDPDDGDEIVAGRAVRDNLVVFKHNSIHVMQGEPGTGTVSFRRSIGGYGCVAARSAVVIGNLCYFLSQDGLRVVDGAGNAQPIPESEPLQPLFAGLTQTALGNACAAYLPSTQCYYLAVPGLQEQFSGGAAPGHDVNDGLFVYHIPTGQWAVYGGIYAASIAAIPGNSGALELWIGDYWGEVFRFTDDTIEGAGATAGTYTLSGTATNGTNNTPTDQGTLEDNGATWPNAFSGGLADRSLVDQWVWITGGTGAGQVRRITSTVASTPNLYVTPKWTTIPSTDSTYRIGNIYAAIEFGDLDLSDPGVQKELEFLIAHIDGTPDTDNDLDAAIATGEVNETGVAFAYGGAGADSTKKPIRISLPARRNPTQRPRIAVRIADTRPQIRAIELEGQVHGKVL